MALVVDDYSIILSLVQCFDEIEDPRINRHRVHNLIDMIVSAICAVICNADGWADMRTLAETHPNNWGDGEVRYYIMSFASDAARFGSAVRQHWGIENSLHWVMDVTFREDESRIRRDNGAENVSWLRRLAVTLIKHNTTRKASIRQKRLRAGYDFEFLLEVLNSVPVVN
jgi:predicted transposase YbfD/YdcC